MSSMKQKELPLKSARIEIVTLIKAKKKNHFPSTAKKIQIGTERIYESISGI